MEDKLISFETAKLAKEKNYSWPTELFWCNYYTGEPTNKWRLVKEINLSSKGCFYSSMEFPAPTQSLLAKWLREVHNLHIEVIPDDSYGKTVWYPIVYHILVMKETMTLEVCNSYEEALEKALEFHLKSLD